MYTPPETELGASSEPQGRVASASPEAEPPRRQKRGKYTSRACEPCKRRKLKCAPGTNGSACQRCSAGAFTCDLGSGPSRTGWVGGENNHDVRALEQLCRQVGDLTETVSELKGRLGYDDTTSPRHSLSAISSTSQRHGGSPRAGLHHRPDGPRQPQFVGPTRSQYSFEMGERSLTSMGIPSFELPPASCPQSAVGSPRDEAPSKLGFWQRYGTSEISRLLGVFQEEVETVYPFIDSQALAAFAPQILEFGRLERDNGVLGPSGEVQGFGFKDFQLAKVAIAIGMVVEEHGKVEDSQAMVESVRNSAARIPNEEVDLKDVQLLTILAVLFFHLDEDLLAWRTIGAAARGALEMGLHRKEFGDGDSRSMATRVFWCVYVLDRRFSFGTSLSFALIEADLCPEIPEPGSEHQYLQCMIGYGRLSSKLWDALMAFGSASHTIPVETATSLDFMTQEWLETIPAYLRLRHPRLGLGSRTQPRVLHRLRALLYLRGNHTRILIYRHHLLNARSIKADLQSAWLVVDIARDTVQVLVHLNATSDIYTRQQKAFNYFLLSALAIIFLAVCHEPAVFAEPCRESFHAAVTLVKDFSRKSKVSRRLWDSIRGLLPRLRRLGMRGAEEPPRQIEASNNSHPGEGGIGRESGVGTSFSNNRLVHASGSAEPSDQQNLGRLGGSCIDMQVPMDDLLDSGIDDQGDLTLTPDMFQVGDDLMALFSMFEQSQQYPLDPCLDFQGPDVQDSEANEDGEMWRRFQGLI